MSAPSVDRWLIAHVFQPVVDVTGRSTEWLSRQAAIMTGLAALMRFGMYSGRDFFDWFWFFVGISSTAAMVVMTYSSLFKAIIAPNWPLRLMCAILCLFDILTLAGFFLWGDLRAALLRIPYIEPLLLISSMSDLSVLAFFYFGACSPPRPRAPRRRLVAAGGAA